MPNFPDQDRLVRKEVALGTIREIEPPQAHIGTRLIAPFKDVASDDVIFDYAKGLTDGLAPARAEDAESELAQKDLLLGGTGRASVVDWALKDHYSASDVTRWNERELLRRLAGENALTSFPLTFGGGAEDYQTKIARDDALRRRKLDNRIEWLIMSQALERGKIDYNDGKVMFAIDFGRPANQHQQAPTSGVWDAGTNFDPIGDINAVVSFMYDTYGVKIDRVLGSKKALDSMGNSDRFVARSGMVGGTGSAPVDLRYLINGWGSEAAKAVVKSATGVDFIEYDAVFRTRAVNSQVVVNTRFVSQDTLIFLPSESDMQDVDDTEIGFAKTLTSPHPEGNFTSGFYEWELETKDPWGRDRGTGIKAFPVFPFMELTYTMKVLT